MAVVNTRLVLRNDELSNWNVSTRELLKGEAAIAWLSGCVYEIRIGVGGKTWNQLGESNVKVSAKNVQGLTFSEYQLQALSAGESEYAKFQLAGYDPSVSVWTAIGDPVTIPNLDLSGILERLDELSGRVDSLSAS